jgi:hypothetical protein
MTTRSGLRQLIRDELNDNAATKLWSDGLLNDYINQAIRAYSRDLPEEAVTTIVVTAGQAAYTLPARFDRALRVEQPQDAIRVLGERAAHAYRVFAGQIILDPEPAAAGADQDLQLEYLRAYAEPAVDGDTLATPAGDDDILVRLACALALRWVSTDESKRMRFERQRGISAGDMATAYDRDARSRIAAQRRGVRTQRLEI